MALTPARRWRVWLRPPCTAPFPPPQAQLRRHSFSPLIPAFKALSSSNLQPRQVATLPALSHSPAPGPAAQSSRARAGGGIGAETPGGAHSPAADSALAQPLARAPGGWALGEAAAPGAGRGGASRTAAHWPGLLIPPPRGRGPEDPGVRPELPQEGGEPRSGAPRCTPTPRNPRAAPPGVQGPRRPDVTHLQGPSPVAASEVSAAAGRSCSAQNRPRALPPRPGPLAGAPPGGRTLLPAHLFASLCFPPIFSPFPASPSQSPCLGDVLPLLNMYVPKQPPKLPPLLTGRCAYSAPALG